MHSVDASAVRARKIERLRAGSAPRVLELCSGCGGLSLGLATAGFQLSAHVEFDAEAAATYARNFSKGRAPDDPWAIARDMVTCTPTALVEELKMDCAAEEAFDVLAAGLPCQAFARIGRSKLRAVTGKDDAFQTDPRAVLYRRFLEYVAETQPLVIIIENVPDILNFGGHNVPEEICETLEQMGYRTGYTILNAAFYGVPQVRERLFILAFADSLGISPIFPEPTHFLELPKGYEGSRRVALKHVDMKSGRFHPIHEPAKTLQSAVSVSEALRDLPKIMEHKAAPKVMRRRKIDDILPYRRDVELTPYSDRMRKWPGFEVRTGACAHLVRITPRDFPIFSSMRQGADYPEARKLAETIFDNMLKLKGLTNEDRNTTPWLELRRSIVPPYDPGKFPNKWWKLEPDKPSRTLTAHMGKDTYSHIHFDGEQSRTVSVREAARLQSFPDGFKFACAMNAAFRQIGNAVPPLLSAAVATAIKTQLDNVLAGVKSDDQQAA